MRLRLDWFIAISFWMPFLAMADSVSLDVFLSSTKLLGGVPCDSVDNSDDKWFNHPIGVFTEPKAGAVSKTKVKLIPGCITGGGECNCWAMFVEKKPLSSTKSFYKVLGSDENYYWISAISKNESSIAKLATLAGASGGEIHLREPKADFFTDPSKQKKLSYQEAIFVPKDIEKKIPPKNSEVYVLFTPLDARKFQEKDYTRFKVEYFGRVPLEEIQGQEDVDAQRIFLRYVWLPTYDKEGRINFWIVEPPGC